jgi:hypothetical protein
MRPSPQFMWCSESQTAWCAMLSKAPLKSTVAIRPLILPSLASSSTRLTRRCPSWSTRPFTYASCSGPMTSSQTFFSLFARHFARILVSVSSREIYRQPFMSAWSFPFFAINLITDLLWDTDSYPFFSPWLTLLCRSSTRWTKNFA